MKRARLPRATLLPLPPSCPSAPRAPHRPRLRHPQSDPLRLPIGPGCPLYLFGLLPHCFIRCSLTLCPLPLYTPLPPIARPPLALLAPLGLSLRGSSRYGSWVQRPLLWLSRGRRSPWRPLRLHASPGAADRRHAQRPRKSAPSCDSSPE